MRIMHVLAYVSAYQHIGGFRYRFNVPPSNRSNASVPELVAGSHNLFVLRSVQAERVEKPDKSEYSQGKKRQMVYGCSLVRMPRIHSIPQTSTLEVLVGACAVALHHSCEITAFDLQKQNGMP